MTTTAPPPRTADASAPRQNAPAVALPLGAIRPTGWLLNQLRLQADGITGALEDIWPDVGPTSAWRGGDGENWERGPYYLDGLVPLAHVLDDLGLIERAQPWIEWILSSQDENGFFGPQSNPDWWPRMIALKVLTQHADATGDIRVEPFLARYFEHQLRELPARPLRSWGRTRGADNALSVWWLYDRTGENWLLELVDLIRLQTADWEHYLLNDLITGKATSFDHFTHGPNVAMGLKNGAVAFLRDGDPEHRERTERSFSELDRWHGQAHGWFSGDEFLGGREATAGLETCQVVEMMFTTENLARIFQGGIYGDRLESLAFNLLPASSDARMRGHQYHQQANQVQASIAHRPWSYSGDDANIFGLEPHFGCCTANLHQGWPKFVRSLWLKTPDDGLMVTAYAPCTVDAQLAERMVHLEVTTSYPFEETITIHVNPDSDGIFAIHLRIPAWCSDHRLAVNEEAVSSSVHDGYVRVERLWTAGDRIELLLPMTPRLIHRERQAVSVALGPLTMALRIQENWVSVPGGRGLGEWEVHPLKSWNYGLVDPRRTVANWRVERTPVGEVPFELEAAPVRIILEVCHVDQWILDGAQAGQVPNGPIFASNVTETLPLVPYGSARLRIVEFPVIKSQQLSPED